MGVFIKVGEVEPFPDGTKVRRNDNGKVYWLKLCNCTSDNIHYELHSESERPTIYHHRDIEERFTIEK